MAKTLTTDGKKRLNAVESPDLGVYLLEITHADLLEPLRLVNDNADLDHDGHTWTAIPFNLTPPDDLSQGMPKGRIEVANVGREIMPWLDQSHGGNGAKIAIRFVFRTMPNFVQWEVRDLVLTNVTATTTTISAQIGFEDVLNLSAVAKRYTPTSQPGIF